MDARAGQAADARAIPEAGAAAPSAPLRRVFDWRRQSAGVLGIAVALAAGLALVPPFMADLAYRDAIAAADEAYLDVAETHLMRAISWTPQNAYLHQFLGEINYRKALFRPQRRQDYLSDALAAFERSARLNPYESETFTFIGWTHLQRGDAQAAEGAFRKARDLDPNSPYVRYSLGTAYLWQKKLPEARTEMEFARRYLRDATEVQIALQEIERLEGAR
jgi:tetratricopeptide (TPR) repeat protein